ncbi:MAG: peptidase [Bdellovibrionaceae bacterium]|nr:peptidase [Pseudobdellovibrionaceae bacterium]|tara:strand:- start:43411 stop:44298 length:888 start_codon:yes stop_codon:yes gene_type:complete
MTQRLCFFILIPLFALSCVKEKNSSNSSANAHFTPNVIYGEDHRKDLYELENSEHLRWAQATVALIDNNKFLDNGDHFQIYTDHYGESRRLCPTERFFEQESAAYCSGFLIAEDLIVTAGHCIRTTTQCGRTQFVFDFAYHQFPAQVSRAEKDNVYSCEELIHSEVVPNGADFAIVKLNRPVIDRSPLDLRSTGEITLGQNLTVIGHPMGLPTKFADGAQVRSIDADFFVANLDTYGGNSGSAVVDSESGIVEGILVRGERDLSYQDGCFVSNTCADDSCRGEDVTKIEHLLPYL